MMSEPRDPQRRSSKRLEEKEGASLVNGIGHENETVRASQKETGKSGKTKTNGANSRSTAKRKPSAGKRCGGLAASPSLRFLWSLMLITPAAYDEEDDGFHFTRAKKARAEPKLPTTVEEEKPEPPVEPAPTKKSKKKPVGSPSPPAGESEPKEGRRRSPRHSGEHEKESADPPPLKVKKRRKDRGSSEMKTGQEGGKSQATQQDPPRQEASQDHTQPIEITFDATKIALPFADTPRIQRNKDMRKTNAARRSSLGLRGRRASSLIDAGKSTGNAVVLDTLACFTETSVAMPHDEVESAEFYKHIESEGLSEPRRMKQLLTWCGTRALGEKPSFASEDSNARLAGIVGMQTSN